MTKTPGSRRNRGMHSKREKLDEAGLPHENTRDWGEGTTVASQGLGNESKFYADNKAGKPSPKRTKKELNWVTMTEEERKAEISRREERARERATTQRENG